MFIKTTFFVIFFLTVSADEVHGRPEVDWFECVKVRLSDLHHAHTALILHHHNSTNSDGLKDELFRTIMTSIPSVIFKLDNPVTKLEGLNFGMGSELSAPRLLIFYGEYSGDHEQIYSVLQLMNELTHFNPINAYFLISLRTSSNFNRAAEDILRHAWNASMHNIMIAEIRSVINVDRFQVMLHHFNPFMNQFYHREFPPAKEVFPDFVQNWHGHRMNVGYDQWPTITTSREGNENYETNYTDPNAVLTQTLAKYLNFNPVYKELNLYLFHLSEPGIDKYVDFCDKDEMDMMASAISYQPRDTWEQSMVSRPIKYENVRIVMPKQYYVDHKPLNKALESSGLTLGIVMIVWLAVILLRFDSNIWHLFNILALMISISITQPPLRTCERSLFIVVAMLGMIYSNYIYALLTNLGFDPVVEMEYNTLEDINASGLPIFAHKAEYRIAFDNAVGGKLKLAEKDVIDEKSDCADLIILKHRNVCCVMTEFWGVFFIDWIRKFMPTYQAKFAKPILWSQPGGFIFRRGFPGKQHVDKLIGKCFEAGLLNKWDSEFAEGFRKAMEMPDYNKPENTVSSELWRQLIVVLIVGYSLATLVFIAELLTHRFKRYLQRRKN